MARGIFSLILYSALSSLLHGQEKDLSDSSAATSGFAYFPIVYYTPETKTAFGAGTMYLSRLSTSDRPSSLTATVIYTVKKQFVGELSTNFYYTNGKYWHSGNFFYENFPNTFYAVGNASPDASEEKFTAEIVRFNPSLMVNVAERLYIGPTIHYESWSLLKTESGRLLSRKTVAGSASTTVFGIGMLMNYDARDNLFAATSGRFYQIGFIASPTFLGSTFSFTRTRIDFREYFSLGSAHVVSTQALLHTTTGTVPFRFLPLIGGQNILRGYFEGRYRDRHMMAMQAEYRSPFVYRFGVALFGGIGEVSDRFSRFSLNGIKPSYGAGIRFAFIPDEHIILRIDYGMGSGSEGLYITFNEAI